MKLSNFKLINPRSGDNQQRGMEIEVEGKIFDLHNAAEFWSIQYFLRERILILDWVYYDQNGNPLDFLAG